MRALWRVLAWCLPWLLVLLVLLLLLLQYNWGTIVMGCARTSCDSVVVTSTTVGNGGAEACNKQHQQ